MAHALQDNGTASRWWAGLTIPWLLDVQARRLADDNFLHIAGQAVTYGEMQESSVRGAHALQRLGVLPGDRVGIMMASSPEWVETWFAAARLDAVVVPINTAYRGDFLSNVLSDSGTSVLAIDRSLLNRMVGVEMELPNLRCLLVREDELEAPNREGLISVEVLPIHVLRHSIPTSIDSGANADSNIDATASGAPANQPVSILYTSGTTGRSKGALVSHHYLLSAASAMVDCAQMRPGEVLYAPLPLFHLSFTGSVLGPLIFGGAGVVDEKFSVSRNWDQVRHYGAAGVLLSGTMLKMLWNLPPKVTDAELPFRFISSGPVPAELYRGIEERYNCKIVISYGMSEAFPVTCAGVHDDNPPGASGRPNPRLDVALVDENDFEIPAGVVGEIVCRPREPHVTFEGYYGRPSETLEQMRNLWFHTGDLGRFDSAGNLTFVDRMKDSIRRRGENVSSFEVEQTILRHPAVVDVAAIGVPSELGEDDVMVYVVVKPGARLNLIELMDHCVDSMPYFAVPRYIEIMDELPRNAIGRVLKPTLRLRGVRISTWDRESAGYMVRR